MQIEYEAPDALEKLSEIVRQEHVGRVLLFTGRSSYAPIRARVETLLQGCEITRFCDFSTNPKQDEIDAAITKFGAGFDLIVAIGGGSVIDFAKAYKYLTKVRCKLAAVPTTAGTGSEATQFAVIYVNGEKHSLDAPTILPDYAVVDSNLVRHNPRYLKACTAMDALCQAIESYWSVKSTPESKTYAKEAILLCRGHLENYVAGDDAEAADGMMRASHLAGKAINISRTTAAHALSYKLTSAYGIPHGHAVAMMMAGLWDAHMSFDGSCDGERLNDPRGAEYVMDIMRDLRDLLGRSPAEYLKLFKSCGPDRSGLLFDTAMLAGGVNTQRLANNPVKLSQDDLMMIVTRGWTFCQQIDL